MLFTGGDPIVQQDKIVQFYRWLNKTHATQPYVEIETNGSRIPSDELIAIIDHWNCPPKLSDSGNKRKRRFNPDAIRTIASQRSASFKFVYSKHTRIEDIEEYLELGIQRNQILVMPAGATTAEFDEVRQKAVGVCIERGWRYTDRLQIVIWEQATGV